MRVNLSISVSHGNSERAANRDKCLKNAERPGVQVARFEIAARPSASDGTDQPLNERVLPRGSRSGNDLLNAHVLDSILE